MKQLLSKSCKTAFAFAFCVLCSIKISAQAGTLDLSFGNQGKVITDIDGYDDYANSVAVQKDGKIVVAGYSFNDQNFSFGGFLVCRYQTNGNLDSSFGINGKVVTAFSGSDDLAHSIVIQPDDKIVVCGSSDGRIALARYDSKGNLDPLFGEGGKVVVTAVYGGQHMIIETDGKFLVLTRPFGLAKFTSDGKLDSSFATNGLVAVQFTEAQVNCNSHILQPDGKIVVVGDVGNDYMNYNFAMARFDSTGKVDSIFGNDGMVVTNFDGFSTYAWSVKISAKDKIILAGGAYNWSDSIAGVSIAQYKSNGKLDSSFGINGKIINHTLHLEIAYSMILNKGKILLTGQSMVENKYYFGLVRLNNEGKADSAFGVNGETYTDFQGVYSIAMDAALQTDGKIILVGSTLDSTDKDNFALARYNNDGSLPVSLFSFTGTQKEKSVLLNWQTANENNNNYFVVERSGDSRFRGNDGSLVELAHISSKGNSSQIQSYSYEDLHPLQGQNFYRLKEIDKDGKFTYSQIVSIDFENGTAILLYPNPVKNILTVDGLNTSAANHLSIVDMKGKIVGTAITEDAHCVWNVRSLAKGIYYLRIETNGKINTIKFMKE
jgi:uncharacterized delta-60 repeat protein